MHEGDDYADWCVLPAVHWVNWGIYQPTRADIIDFSGANGHADTQTGRNIGADEIIYDGLEDGSPIVSEHASSFLVEDLGMEKVPTDVGCNFRTTVRGAGTHMQSLALTDSAGDFVWSNDGVTCDSTTLYLDAGSTYTITFGLSTRGVNDSVTMISDYSAVS